MAPGLQSKQWDSRLIRRFNPSPPERGSPRLMSMSARAVRHCLVLHALRLFRIRKKKATSPSAATITHLPTRIRSEEHWLMPSGILQNSSPTELLNRSIPTSLDLALPKPHEDHARRPRGRAANTATVAHPSRACPLAPPRKSAGLLCGRPFYSLTDPASRESPLTSGVLAAAGRCMVDDECHHWSWVRDSACMSNDDQVAMRSRCRLPLSQASRLSASCSGRSSGGCEGREAAALKIPAIQARPLQAPYQGREPRFFLADPYASPPLFVTAYWTNIGRDFE